MRILVALLLLGCLSWTQGVSFAPTQNEGKFFAIGFPQTYGGAGKCEVVITASRGAVINVECKHCKIDDKNIYLAGGTSKRYSIGWNLRVPAGLQVNYPVYITADNDIKVEVGVIGTTGEMDAYLAMPVTDASKEFLHVSHRHPTTHAALLVVATEDDTDLEIFQRDVKNEMGYVRKVYQKSMKKFNTYVWHHAMEMTGSVIRADKPISVISAALCTRVPPEPSNCEPVIEYLPPTAWLGTMHIVPAIAGRAHTTGYITRVTAAHDNTDVWTYGKFRNRHYFLERGQFVDIHMHSPLPTSVECTEPCLVTVFNRGPAADGRYSDGFMMYVPSVGQMVNSMLDFNTFLYTTGAEASYHLGIVAKADEGATPSFMLNHRPLYIKEWHCVNGAFGCDYKYANMSMSHGFHAITPTSKNTKYLAWQYAHSNTNSPPSKYNGYGLITAFNPVDVAEEMRAKEAATAYHDIYK